MQQQQPFRKEGVKGNSKEVATWESGAGTRDEPRDATGVAKASGNSGQTHLSGQRSRYRCTLENRSEYSNRKSENWFEQHLYSRRPGPRKEGVQ